MIQADCVYITPPTNTSANNPPGVMTHDDELGMAWWNALSERQRAKWSAIAGNTGRVKDAWEAFKRGSANQTPPVDQARRRFLAVAAFAGAAGAGSLAAAAMAPNDVPAAATTPRHSRPDPAFALIADKIAGDIAHGEVIDAQDEADECGIGQDEAYDRCCAACDAVDAIDWKLATTPPTTLAGVAAVLRFANEMEDAGLEWPKTDVVGAEGWHYQLRATMAAAIEDQSPRQERRCSHEQHRNRADHSVRRCRPAKKASSCESYSLSCEK